MGLYAASKSQNERALYSVSYIHPRCKLRGIPSRFIFLAHSIKRTNLLTMGWGFPALNHAIRSLQPRWTPINGRYPIAMKGPLPISPAMVSTQEPSCVSTHRLRLLLWADIKPQTGSLTTCEILNHLSDSSRGRGASHAPGFPLTTSQPHNEGTWKRMLKISEHWIINFKERRLLKLIQHVQSSGRDVQELFHNRQMTILWS